MARLVAASLALALALTPGCAGCENSACCAVPGHTLPEILRPSACTSMSGTSVDVAMCDVICCEADDGTVAPSPRMSCRNVVALRLCDTTDAMP